MDYILMEEIIKLIKTLRGENGCAWDKKQTPDSISLYLIEEMYELLDAIENGDTHEIINELGDVLFQVLFLSVLYSENLLELDKRWYRDEKINKLV